MYRNYTRKKGMPLRLYRKLMLIMRLTTVLLIASLMQVSAAGFAQKISMSKSSAPLEEVISELRKQSGYDFIATGKILDQSKAVTINVKNTEFKDVLKQIFEDQPLTYLIENNTVTLKEKEPSFLDKVVGYFNSINVRGRVVDDNFQPLQGASVSVKNGKGVVNTDQNGFFYLKNVDENATLVFTYIGFTKKRDQPRRQRRFG